jgi:hypothetical protein
MLLLTLGINEQGATIEKQRALIALLNRDSQQLMAMHAREANQAQQKAADPQVAPDAKAAPPRQSAPNGATKAPQPPKMETVIDPREIRRVLLKA